MAADFGAIESRILAWLSGEEWKLKTYLEFDRTDDKAIEPYRVVRHEDAAEETIPLVCQGGAQ